MIYTHRWNPSSEHPEKSCGVYLLHGTGEHAGRYEQLAQRLAGAGYRVGAHDHPGHGQSDGTRGLIDPPGALVTQAAIQIQQFALETGSSPIVFAHSLGCVIATELVLEHGLNVKALILSAPAFVPQMSWFNRLQLTILSLVAPMFRVEIPYNPSLLTSDPEQQKIAQADALNHGYKSASLIGWLVRSGGRSLGLAQSLDTPTLLLIAGADSVVDSEQTRSFASSVPGHRITVHEYDGYLHEILNETPERRALVLDDIEAWLNRIEAKDSDT